MNGGTGLGRLRSSVYTGRPEQLVRLSIRQDHVVSTLYLEKHRKVCIYAHRNCHAVNRSHETMNEFLNKDFETDPLQGSGSQGAYGVYKDLRYLSVAPMLDVHSDFYLSCVTQGLCRSFSNRLTGFNAVSLNALYRDFLDFTASVESDNHGYKAKLGNPPLGLVLSMSGLLRQQYILQDSASSVVELYPQSE